MMLPRTHQGASPLGRQPSTSLRPTGPFRAANHEVAQYTKLGLFLHMVIRLPPFFSFSGGKRNFLSWDRELGRTFASDSSLSWVTCPKMMHNYKPVVEVTIYRLTVLTKCGGGGGTPKAF